jgi:preprotein translocase subunit SecE
VKTSSIIWIVAIAAIFGLLWWKGQIQRFAAYWRHTREELRKCTWPTWDELKGSTVVIMVAILIMGVFTFVVDRILFALFKII